MSGYIVDHLAAIQFISSIVSARLEKDQKAVALINEITDLLDQRETWGFYAKAWLISKYGSPEDIMILIESTVSLWVAHELPSRVAAAMYPRFLSTPMLLKKFENIVSRDGSRWAQDVFSFHKGLSTTTLDYTAIKSFIRATNNSVPNQLTHSKFLMLLSLLHNESIAPTAVTDLRGAHSVALTDPFYAAIAPPPRAKMNAWGF
jgi:hypothetical protein